MNEFRYIAGVSEEIQQGLAFWLIKALEYTNTYYQGNRENAKGTKFYRCMSKTDKFFEEIIEKSEFIRGVIDDQNLLACLCFIQETTILFEDDFIDCLEIESLSNSPWNTIKYPQYEKRKGAATSLIEGIIKEARNKGLSEVLKLFAVPEEKSFYQRLGFVETNGSGEMILDSNAVAMFLLDLDQKRNSSTFD